MMDVQWPRAQLQISVRQSVSVPLGCRSSVTARPVSLAANKLERLLRLIYNHRDPWEIFYLDLLPAGRTMRSSVVSLCWIPRFFQSRWSLASTRRPACLSSTVLQLRANVSINSIGSYPPHYSVRPARIFRPGVFSWWKSLGLVL